ncbi:bifunctional aspartate kinase/homoserine dehydrogenase I [candidate division KSB1 bacterium]|nr:bifunctional aspartate kinase/homoserine dehydrogenase I [candidate division KSB1 bacterium]
MKILKFGGSTLFDADSTQKVIQIIQKESKQEQSFPVVVSAFSGITDLIIELSHCAANHGQNYKILLKQIQDTHTTMAAELIPEANQSAIMGQIQTMFAEMMDTLHGVFLVRELSFKTLDFVLSFGETLAATILTAALQEKGSETTLIDPRTFIVTDNRFGFAHVNFKESEKKTIEALKDKKGISVIPGFIGATADGETTTLGRGASDLTATLVGAALKADEIEIWTDVNGIMTADPQKVPKAISIDSLSFVEALELSHFGARIIRPQAMHPAIQAGIPVRIRNIHQLDYEGTCIDSEVESAFLVKGISSIDEIALLRIQGSGLMGVVGISNRLFGALAKQEINVILITQASSEHSICIAVCPESADLAKDAIGEEFDLEISAGAMEPIIVERDRSIVAIVGENMRSTPGISARLFEALGKNGINVIAIAQGSSERNISVVIDRTDESKALNTLHDAFFLSGTKSIHLFILGTGLIGGTLLKQIQDHTPHLQKQSSLEIRVVGIGNIDGMVFNVNGLNISKWQILMEKSGQKINLDRYINTMLDLNLPNSVFVDATGIETIVDYYEQILGSAISIVTPNKIANSGPLSRYNKLKECVSAHGVKFLYETNVGAGLPVLSTLNDLMSSGDQILKIEAVLSGTLSYIFNSFNGDRQFSEIVREARDKGLSEPDPRDDLNGLDVARKILILARDSGIPLEPKDVEVENILNAECRKAPTVDAFLRALEKSDPEIEERRKAAEKNNAVLRYIACLENGKASVKLQEVNGSHPFYGLSGSDNMIVFTTDRYKERPLVIKGPGAGAEVTAAGVFADIIRIANYLS